MSKDTKWEYEKRQMSHILYRPAIRFTASVLLPVRGHFHMEELYETDTEKFLTHWIDGATGTIWDGPETNVVGEYSGKLLVRPIVRVRHHKSFPDIINKMFGIK